MMGIMPAISLSIIYRLLIGLFFSFGFAVYLLIIIPDSEFHIYFLDVGQGDSIYIKTPENHQIIIDGGPNNVVMESLGDVIPFFDKSIDLMVLTHPHADHIDGLVEMLHRYKVQSVLITGVNYSNSTYDEFLNILVSKNIEVFIAEDNFDLKFGDVFLDIIYPFDQIVSGNIKNINNSSIAIKVLYKDRSILLTGDLEEEIESELVEKQIDLKSDIYKAGHHGSRTASGKGFLIKVLPDIVVIQCGIGNSFGHPHEESLSRMNELGIKNIIRTDIEGMIEFIF